MSKKTAAVGAVAFVAVAGFVGFGLWKASQPAPEVFQGPVSYTHLTLPTIYSV